VHVHVHVHVHVCMCMCMCMCMYMCMCMCIEHGCVPKDGRALEFAPPELQADREVVLAAVRQPAGRQSARPCPSGRARASVELRAKLAL
jgi:hypothetical protein